MTTTTAPGTAKLEENPAWPAPAWPAVGARIAELHPQHGVRVDVVATHTARYITLKDSKTRYRHDTRVECCQPNGWHLLPLDHQTVRTARAAQAYTNLAARVRALEPHDARLDGRGALRSVVAYGQQLLTDLDHTAEFEASRPDVLDALRRLAIDTAAHEDPRVVRWCLFFCDLADELHAEDITAFNALQKVRSKPVPEALYEMLQEQLEHLQTCERCDTIGDVDADCGLCAACVDNNNGRVVL